MLDRPTGRRLVLFRVILVTGFLAVMILAGSFVWAVIEGVAYGNISAGMRVLFPIGIAIGALAAVLLFFDIVASSWRDDR